jgi:hypothetical protein
MMDTLLQHSIHAWFSEFLQELKAPQQNVLAMAPAKVASLHTGARDRGFAAHH